MSQKTGCDPFDRKWSPICEAIGDSSTLCISDGRLKEPLRYRKSYRVLLDFDLFENRVPDEWIDRIFAVMALAPQHTFQILTKRPERMRAYLTAPGPRRYDYILRAANLFRAEFPSKRLGSIGVSDPGFMPLPNVWLGVSVEDQATADARIPLLLQTPAAVRFVSAEPLLGPVDLSRWLDACPLCPDRSGFESMWVGRDNTREWFPCAGVHPIDWLIVGGESGPGARPCDVAWIRSIVEHCKAAAVPVFVKQLGAIPFGVLGTVAGGVINYGPGAVRLRSRKGGDPSEWPEDLRVREFPEAR